MTAILLFLAWGVSIVLAFVAGAFAGVEHEKRTMLPILSALQRYIESSTKLSEKLAEAASAQVSSLPAVVGRRGKAVPFGKGEAH